MGLKEEALEYHAGGRAGKIEVTATKPLATQRDLSLAYTPGVADACRAIHADPHDVFKYTAKGNLVAVVTNGTAVLGLGDIGPMAGKPVMEGKANLFKKFADIDVFDIELDASHRRRDRGRGEGHRADVRRASTSRTSRRPSASRSSAGSQEELDIPVFHDDQHGTAIISAAAMLNATELTGRDLGRHHVRVLGRRCRGDGLCSPVRLPGREAREHRDVRLSRGSSRKDRRQPLVREGRVRSTGTRKIDSLAEALRRGGLAFVGLSVGGVLNAELVQKMAAQAVHLRHGQPRPRDSRTRKRRPHGPTPSWPRGARTTPTR